MLQKLCCLLNSFESHVGTSLGGIFYPHLHRNGTCSKNHWNDEAKADKTLLDHLVHAAYSDSTAYDISRVCNESINYKL